MPETKIRSAQNPRRSPSQWRAIFNRFEKSDLTIKEFCHIKSLAPATFSKWRRKFRQENGLPGFIELQPAPNPSPAAQSWSLQIDCNGLSNRPHCSNSS